MLTLNDTPLLSMAGDIRFDVIVAETLRRPIRPFRGWSRHVRRGLGMRGPAHALLADAQGVWAWQPGDQYAAAQRYGGVREWMRSHSGSDVRLWVSGELTQSIEDVTALPPHDAGLRSHARQALVERHGDAAASWPLATWRNDVARGVVALTGFDLDVLRHQGVESDVRIRSVEPWWHHAFLEARRCVPALAASSFAHVCVVEGRAAVWITLSHGVMSTVRRCVLDEPTVASLSATIARLNALGLGGGEPTVVLGQGLVDGGDTRALDAHVLGRLDGDQPPQWLRPCTQIEVH